MAKLKILTFTRWYLPGHKAGGPIRTISNMVEKMGDEFDFRIITTDRDFGDEAPYPGIEADCWLRVNKAVVCYLDRQRISARKLADLVEDVAPDCIYLNSFFDPLFTIRLLVARRFGYLTEYPIVLAPRGEFSEGSIGLKRFKKQVYLFVARIAGLLNDLTWQASSKFEAGDIEREFGTLALKKSGGRIVIAPDIARVAHRETDENPWSPRDGGEPLRICFLSRISRTKNLDYALRVLKSVRVSTRFTIYGPKEDVGYWEECEQIIATLPGHIHVDYVGAVDYTQVHSTLAQHDLFFLPTRGENFGHVIHEALSAGLPVLLSDQTPWRQLEAHSVGWDLSLDDVDGFVEIITRFSALSLHEQAEMKKRCRSFAESQVNTPEVLRSNRELFLKLTLPKT